MPLGCSEPPTPAPAPPPPTQIAIDDLQRAPVVGSADAQHRDVFKLLDGEWRGRFLIYVDGRGYGDDDPSLAPRRYFVATYRRPTK